MEYWINDENQTWLGWFLRGILFLGIVFLGGRLIELQIIKGSYYKSLSDGNRIRRVSITAPRGQILARGGETLVGNREVPKRVIFDQETGYSKSSDLGGASEDEIITEYVRSYELGEDFGHVSGYLGEVNENEVGKVDPKCLEKGPKRLGLKIGRTGLEERYDCILRGIDGEEIIEVNTLGKKIRTLGRRIPIPGSDIKTEIDMGLQKKVAGEMRGKKGGAVLTDGKGQVLALYSYPSYDPSIFVAERNDKTKEKIESLLKDKNLPIFNRVIGGTYHPGSVFKIVTAAAALEEKKIDNDFTYNDEGIIKVGDFSYTNWYFTQYGRTEGRINLTRAIARSTDTFFYKIGEMVGPDKLAFWAGVFGLGQKAGLDLSGEVSGLVPNPEWKKETKGERWFLGNTYHMAIGQGDLAVTPLEVNIETAVIANGGKVCRPGIVEDPKCKETGLKKETIEEIKKGMIAVCKSGGTAFPFFNFPLEVACKTGTAETPIEGKTHAWFTVFGPADFPQIVMTVLVEEGGEGSYNAAPVARKVFDYYFNVEDSKNIN